MLVREIKYRGRFIYLAVLPEHGHWGYCIEDGPVRMVHETRGPMQDDELYREAETVAKAEVESAERRSRGLH